MTKSRIAIYCETDVVNTYRIWLRYELFRGWLNPNGYAASERHLGELLKAREKPHLTQTMELNRMPVH